METKKYRLFTVVFMSGSSIAGSAIEMEKEPIGLKALDEFREVFSDKVILIENLPEFGERFWNYLEAPIVEQLARESGQFQNAREIKVRVKSGGLNQYCHRTPARKPDGSYHYPVICRTEQVLDAWEKAGFPTIWEESK